MFLGIIVPQKILRDFFIAKSGRKYKYNFKLLRNLEAFEGGLYFEYYIYNTIL